MSVVNKSNDSDVESDHTQKLKAMLNSPSVLSASIRRQVLQEKIRKLPQVVKNRVSALKNLQLEHIKLEAKFYEEIHQLEMKYQKLYDPLQTKRSEILRGTYEPTAEEAVPQKGTEPESDDESETDGLAEGLRDHLQIVYKDDVKGVPDFWLTVLQFNELTSSMIQPHDVEALKALQDLRVVYHDDLSYTIEFHFGKNEFFSNDVLTKRYYLSAAIDAEAPFVYEGPEIKRCDGCTIDWLPEKNLTVKLVKKKQKHKERNEVRMVSKPVPTDSFFNFFNPPAPTEDEEDEDTAEILETDYEIGHFLRARIIPKGVLLYTGDLVDDEDDVEEYDEEEEEEEEDDDDDDEQPNQGKQRRTHAHGPKGQNPAECKQQ